MTKSTKNEGPVNRHKQMAMGKEIKVMKTGGAVEKAKGGMCHKEGGMAKKKK